MNLVRATRAPLASCIAVAFAAAAAAPQAHAGPPMVTVPYTTRSGDTLYTIAARYLRNPQDWRLLSRLNHVPAPRHMPAGMVLRLPANALKWQQQSARVIATSGPVEHAFGHAPYTTVATGMMLGEGDRLRTGRNGFATLELPEGSHISLTQEGLVEIGKLRETVLTGATDRVIDLRRGEVNSEVTRATKKDDRFLIRSPSVVAGVRGTRFRVNYDDDQQQTAVEVLQGAVGVDRAGANAARQGLPLQSSEQFLTAQFGSVSVATGELGSPMPLLAAPALRDSGKIQDGKAAVFNIEPAHDAAGYRLQIARDADLLDLVRDQRVSEPDATFNDLPDGTWFVRVSAIDRNGLEGLSRTYAFERRRLGLSASAEPRDGGQDYTFRWFASGEGIPTRFRFVLARAADLREPIVDRTDLAAGQIVVTDLPAGVYYWSVIAEQVENGRIYQKASSIRSFTLGR